MQTNKEERVLNYYVLCNKLKDVIRTGWKTWNVKRDRLEKCCWTCLWRSDASNCHEKWI